MDKLHVAVAAAAATAVTAATRTTKKNTQRRMEKKKKRKTKQATRVEKTHALTILLRAIYNSATECLFVYCVLNG